MANCWIVGNWKLNGSQAMLSQFSQALAAADGRVSIAVPACFLGSDTSLDLGAQDVSEHTQGAYTGEISASMLAEAGASFGLVGHSERRQYHGESDELVNQKVLRLLDAGVKPVICVGEDQKVRQREQTVPFVEQQLRAAIRDLPSDADFAIAYEPVWAIGTGQAASPEQAQAVHQAIRQTLAQHNARFAELEILYGGSVNPDNAAGFLSQNDINGALIGGAALNVDNLIAIDAVAKEL